jgi:S-DNA-T family DNA segregation ATPase FtsK/SpoIIIE
MPLKLPEIPNPFRKAEPAPPPAPPPKGKTAKKESKSKPAGKSAAAGKKGAPAPAPQPAAPPPPPPPLFKLSPERQIDLVGVFLAMLGGLLLITHFSPGSFITDSTVSFLAFLLGWGGYIFPVALVLIGLWLIVRKIERIPPVSVERLTGIILLLFFFQAAAQSFDGNPDPAFGIGGGWLGSKLYSTLVIGLGENGALVVLLAWFVIAIILTFDLTLPELLQKLKPFWIKLAGILGPILAKLRTLLFGRRSASEQPAAEPAPAIDGFTPLNRPADPVVGAPAAVGIPVTTIPAQIVWVLPQPRDILNPGTASSANEEFVEQRARLIEETLASFGAPAQVVEINSGPSVTQFGVEPLFVESRSGRTRVRVSKIVSLADDLALALAAPRIRIQAPVPGRSYVGIEVPNDEMTLVSLREIVESEPYLRSKKSLSFALGRDVSGHPITADLGAMPHLLIAGTTGSGKSVCVNAILTCLLLNNTPDDLRLVLVDPKRVELTGYNGIPHLLSPVVVEMERVIGALQWMTREMDRRYHLFAQVGARNIADYNARQKTQGQKKLPFLVVIIDELADLMMLAPDETERTITRLAQLARATGIHLILATQRPSVDVVTGLIKANFPARIAFAVASNTDSRVILDQPGAERLLGRGDMLYQSPEAPAPVRLQGVFVSDSETHRLSEFWREQNSQAMPIPPGGAVDGVATNVPLKQASMFSEDITAMPEQGDHLMSEAIDLVRREGRASVSMLQRRLRIGYTRAARLVDNMEDKGIIGAPEDNTGVRKVLDYGPTAPPKEA